MSPSQPTQREFLKLAIPNIITNLSVPMAGLIDVAILGHLNDINPLAGVALAGLLFDFAYWGFAFLRMSTTGLTAKAFGAGKARESAAVFFRAFALALLAGAFLILIQKPYAYLGFQLLEGEPAVEAAGKAYFYARIWGAPATMGGYVVVGWLLGRQRATDALIFALVLNGTNVFLDWLFIYQFGMGAQGAGLATMLAELASFLVGLFLVWRAWRDLPGFSFDYFRDKATFIQLLVLNGNIMIRTLCLIGTFAVFTNFSALMGSVLLAANTILLRLLNTAAYFIDGFAYALESLAGKYAGAEQWQRVRRSLTLALAWNLFSVLIFLGIFFLFRAEIFGLLTSHQPVIQEGVRYFPWVSGILILSGFAYIFDGFFIGLADGTRLRNSMLWATLVGFVPLAWISRELQAPHLLWFSMFLFMGIRSVTLGWSGFGLLRNHLLSGQTEVILPEPGIGSLAKDIAFENLKKHD